ncbi:MAG: hypothetical protein NTW78_06015 [Campylobacterales bacterium]|nr:hypothetical protein [Campylobacterales bacterium]
MAISTKYPVEIEIDETKYSVTVSEATKAQTNEIDVVSQGYKEELNKRAPIQEQLNEAREDFAINKEILAHGSVVEKVKVMFEQKALNKEIFRLERELEVIDKSSTNFGEMLEDIFSKRFDLQVSGADKASLKKEIENKSIGYKNIFNEIGELVTKSKEKK